MQTAQKTAQMVKGNEIVTIKLYDDNSVGITFEKLKGNDASCHFDYATDAGEHFLLKIGEFYQRGFR